MVGLTEIEPRNFSFNSPHGACPVCTGLGTTREFDPDTDHAQPGAVVCPGRGRALAAATGRGAPGTTALLEGVAANYGFSLNAPVRDLPGGDRRHPQRMRGKKVTVRYKSRSGRMRSYAVEYEGVIPNLQRRYARDDRPTTCARSWSATWRSGPARHVPRRAPQTGGAGASRSASGSIVRRHRHADPGGARTGSRRVPMTLADRAAARDRPRADLQGDPRAARLPGRRRARLPDARRATPARCRAARRSASGWRRRSARG